MEPRIDFMKVAPGGVHAPRGMGHVPDHVFEETRRHFSDAELTNLTLRAGTRARPHAPH